MGSEFVSLGSTVDGSRRTVGSGCGLSEPQVNACDLDLLIALAARVGLGENLRSVGT